jgi:lipopolysaccharide transport system permease protein
MRIELIRALWQYRGFILSSIKRDFRMRYTGSFLGATWNVLNPLVQIVIWTLIFAEVMRARLPGLDDRFAYSIFLCAGQLTWALFADTVSRLLTVFIDNANLLKKSSFPRICLPVIAVGTALLNFAIVFGIFLLFLAVTGRFPGWEVLTLIPVLLIQIVLAFGIGIVCGSINVFFRDVGHLINVVLQFWFWLTPIVYPASVVPDFAKSWLALNPMMPLVGSYQRVFLGQGTPDWAALAPLAIVSVLIFVGGFWVYKRLSGEMVDEL